MVLSNSDSTASAIGLIANNTNVASQESCNNSQIIQSDKTTFVAGNIECEDFSVGNVTATSAATCEQYNQVAILSKVVADQTATSEAATGIGLFDGASSQANTFIDVQNNISAIIAASCTNSQKINIGERSFTAGNISGRKCNIFNDLFTQEAACLQTLEADITNSTETSQTAKSKATSGLDLGQIILFLVVLCFTVFFFMIAAAVFRSMILGGNPSDVLKSKSGLFGSGGPSLSELSAKRNALQRTLAARQAATASRLSTLDALKSK